MIGKLMKYDLKKMFRILVYIYVCAISLAGITRLINIGKDIQILEIIGYIFAGCTYSAIGSVLINTFVQILRVFIGDFYKDESYLTHTLPVEKSKLLISKYLSSLIVIVCSVLVSFLSLFVVLYSKELFEGIRALLEVSVAGFNMSIAGFLTLLIFIVFEQICGMISMAFASIIIGCRENSRRILKGLLTFIAFYMISMMFTFVILAIVFAISGNIGEFFASSLSQGSFITILILGLVLYFVYAVGFFLISYKLFKKGVNVD
ncbi:MAG: hypothetical protein IJW59_01735 [Clostridia bacterium]|nr:hypothetical protein [Clostridia bacterium]